MVTERREGMTPLYPENITLNRDFQLFNSASTFIEKKNDSYNFSQYTSFKILNTGLMPPMLLMVRAAEHENTSIGVITPFNPEIGYRITSDDFDTYKRIEKYLRSEPLFYTENSNLAPLTLLIRTADDSDPSTFFEDKVIVDELERISFEFAGWLEDDENKKIARSLYLRLKFPGLMTGSLLNEGILNDSTNDDFPQIYFDMFHPIDTGPLPVDADVIRDRNVDLYSLNIFDGLYINVPETVNEINSIRGNFTIKPNLSHK